MSVCNGQHRRGPAPVATGVHAALLGLVLAFTFSLDVWAQSVLPVPKPRPAADNTGGQTEDTPAADTEPAPIEAIPLQPKPEFDLAGARACEAELRRLSAQFAVLDPVTGEGQCGWPRPLRLGRLSKSVETVGQSMLRCEVALALARWSKEVVVPSAKLHMGAGVSAIEVSTTYQCRRRNNAPTGKLSEHGFANGVDLLAFRLETGDRVAIRDRTGEANGERAFQAAVRGGACAYFTTVLGPTANPAHAEHFHLDLAVRRGGYRLCE